MASNSAEMKVKATMDNSDLKKKSKESKEALKDFAKVGEDAVSSLGNAFGVNTGKIEQMMSAVRGLGENLSKSSNTGAAALGNLLKGVNGLSAGIAGLGIGAAVAGFKMLKDEAENFKNTVAGANIELQTTAYIETYIQVIHDYNQAIGKAAAETDAALQKSSKTLGATFKAFFTSGGFWSALTSGSAYYDPSGMEEFAKVIGEATSAADKAEKYTQRIFTIQRLISDSSVEWARQEREIAEYKRIAYDKTVDTKTQQEALAKATELINERYGDEAILRGRLANMQEKMNALSKSSIEDIDKANQLRIQEEATIARMNNALRELSERQATLTKQAETEAQARAEALMYTQMMREEREKLQNWGNDAKNVPQINTPNAVALNTPGLAIPATIEPELNSKEVVASVEQLEQMIGGTFASISASLGGLVGDLINGENAWDNFGAAALSAMADLAIQVGKLCVATGAASLGIKKALELQPEAALIAGVALIALGTAVKQGLANAANGSYSSAGAVATSTGSYGSSSSSIGTSFDTRDITVNVRGSLRADGNQLLAVIENENTRRNHTT